MSDKDFPEESYDLMDGLQQQRMAELVVAHHDACVERGRMNERRDIAANDLWSDYLLPFLAGIVVGALGSMLILLTLTGGM